MNRSGRQIDASKLHDRIRVSILSRPPARIGPDLYRRVCSQFATGVAVATVCAADGTPHGLTISSFTAVSIEPPLILMCIDYVCQALEHFRSRPYFAINVLTAAQREISVDFAAKPESRFEGVDWQPGQTGAPLLSGVLAVLECKLDRVLEAGDHAVIFGEVVGAEVNGGEPLLYFNRSYRTLR
jgi:3-hydroxy-9,10-secoandrosta-1,3,5(10)-triene-9,17-dione monooxygenase reductase component